MDERLQITMAFFLGQVARELRKEIDWRAKGYGKNVFVRVGIYLASIGRDLVRIPTHNPQGIGQSRFRARVEYIVETAIPTLAFFSANYPLSEERRLVIAEAIDLLERGARLISDGAILTIDEWYATMDEFHQLSEFSQEASARISAVLQDEPTEATSSTDTG